MADESLKRKEIPLTGKLITREDPAIIGTNFRQLTNMRYTRTNPKGIGGHSKINTTALSYPKVRSGIHFKKEQPAETHVLVEAYNSGLSATEIYQNTTAIPGTGDYSASIFTPTAGAGRGRWSSAPDGYVAYANGEETCIWGGNESQVGGFINYDPANTFFKEQTDNVSDTISTGSGHVATINRVATSTADDALLLHLENNVTDSAATTVHTVTNNNVTFSSGAKKFGSYGAVFTTNAYLTVPDHAEFDFSGGTFCIDTWFKSSDFTSSNVLYYQKTDIERVGFTLGTNEPSVGDTLVDVGTVETAIIDYVEVTSGSWAGNDAAGFIYAHTVSGVFSTGIAKVGATNIATLDGDFADHGDNYIILYVDTSRRVNLVVHECYGSGSNVVGLTTTAITSGIQTHIEVDENGDDWYIFIDGQQKAYTSDSSRAKNYIGLVQIGYNNAAYLEASLDEYRVSTIARHTADFEPSIAAYGTGTTTYMYVGAIMPLEGIKFYVSTANTTAAVAVVDYWNGSEWTPVSTLVDGTAVTGASLAQTGTMTFDSTASTAKVKSIKGVVIYWYRVSIPSLDDGVGIYYITVKTAFQSIRDIWDGVSRKTSSFYKYTTNYNDFTLNVRDDDYDSANAATYVNLDGLTSSQYIVCGFTERQTGIRFNIVGDKGNDTANTVASVYYWNGTTWATVGGVSDETSEGNISFAQSGLITWSAISDGLEFQTEFTGAPKDTESAIGSTQSPPLYYYKVSFSQTLSGDASNYLYLVQVTGIPAQKTISKYKFPLNAMDRLWLFSDQKGRKNTSICSSESTVNVFNGDDSYEIIWGDESEVTGGAWLYSQYGSSVYSTIVVFKKSETWVLIGNDPEEWRKYKISSSIGCVAPETIRVIELPTDPSSGVTRSSIAVFQGANGIYMTDGRPPVLISEDIGNLFDKRETIKINASYVDDSFAFNDISNSEYHWCFAVGSAVDYEYVLDYDRMKWYNISRPAALQAGIEVEDTNGVTYVYGAVDTGFLLRLENGNNFDGTAIAHTMWFGDIALYGDGSITIETDAQFHNLVAVTKTTTNDITVIHYGDSSTTGNTLTMVPRKTGYRTIRTAEHKKLGSHMFHSWKFTISTGDQAVGFEPLFFACLYKVSRDYVKDYRS